MVVWLSPAFREPSKSESTRGSNVFATLEWCGPALVLPPNPDEVPVVPDGPVVRFAPAFREPSRSESTRGSSLFAMLELCGPAFVLPASPDEGLLLVLVPALREPELYPLFVLTPVLPVLPVVVYVAFDPG